MQVTGRINYSEEYKSDIRWLLRTIEDNYFSMIFVMGTITSIDKSNLVVIPTYVKDILIVRLDLIESSVGKFGC